MNHYVLTSQKYRIFRKPVLESTIVKIVAKMTERKGRKIFMSATVFSTEDIILVEATALFITMQKEIDVNPTTPLSVIVL